MTPESPRTLQPSAWRRALGLIIVAVIVLSVVLQEPVALLLPEATPRWLLFVAIAVPVAAAIVGGLSLAYPRIVLDADGVLRSRGLSVPLGDIVGLRRSLSSGPTAGYLVYYLSTREGRSLRVLVAGAPIRGLDVAQLGVLREVIAASGVPVASDSAEAVRAIAGQNLLGDGRRAELDRDRALRELDSLRGADFQPVPDAPAAAPADVPGAPVPIVGESVAAGPEPSEDWMVEAEADDVAAAEQVLAASAGTRMLRLIVLAAFVLTCLGGVGVLIALVVREASGAWVGDASNDALVAAMAIMFALVILTGIAWGAAADVDDALRRRLSQRWLAEASEAQRVRGLPSPFHAAWLRPPGGRMTGFALFVFGMLAMFTVVAGPVMLFGDFGPPLIGVVLTVIGVALSALGLWGWFARRRAHARRVEWLLEVAGQRVHGVEPPSR